MRNNFSEELNLLVKQQKKSFKLNSIDIRQIFNTKHEVNLKRDETGMPIVGTGRVITNDEKKMIFDYILDNNYPVTQKMYTFLLKGYIDGELELSMEKPKKL